ncbi:MAG: glycosyl hydrolase family 28-related protein [Acidimicrobiales bacterium]
MPGTSPFFNVADYGATGDGKTDDTAAITAAIAAASPPASSATGNTVFFPAGRYLVTSGVEVPAGLALEGTGWNTPGSQVNPFAGTWILVGAGSGFSPVNLSGGGSAVRRIAFNVPDQPKAGAPPEAGAMVHVTANNTLVEDVFVYNPYGGVHIDGGAQTVVRRLFGQPVQYGLMIDRSQDVNYIDAVHFWPYWQPANTDVGGYQLARGTALLLLRCDNPHLSNVFAYNYNKGFSLGGSPAGTPHKVHLMNADFDGCVTGVHIGAPGQAGYAVTLQMANVTVQAPAHGGAPKGHGIWVEAASAYAMVQASNLRVAHSGLHAIHIDAENVSFHGENVSLEHWAGDTGFFISSSTSSAWLGAGFAYTPGGTPFAPKRQFHLAKV